MTGILTPWELAAANNFFGARVLIVTVKSVYSWKQSHIIGSQGCDLKTP